MAFGQSTRIDAVMTLYIWGWMLFNNNMSCITVFIVYFPENMALSLLLTIRKLIVSKQLWIKSSN